MNIDDFKSSHMMVSENVNAELIEKLDKETAIRFLTQNQRGRANLDDSFYMCDLGDIAMKCQLWNDLFPRTRPFYAVKAAPYEPMIKCLSMMGIGFDCAGQDEIDLVLRCGAKSGDIVYSNPNKQKSHVLHAKRHGVKLTVFDKESELRKIKKYYPETGLLLRISVERVSVIANPYERFGTPKEKAKELLLLAKSMELKVIGISFHIGTGCTDPTVYVKAIKNASGLFEFAKQQGMDFTVLDIGGGFPGCSDAPCSIQKLATAINSCIEDLFPVGKYKGLRIISEPGRYFATSAFTLATNVISKSEPNSDVEIEYTVNDGIFGSFSHLEVAAPGDLKPLILDALEKRSRVSRVWGGTMSTRDILIANGTLPEMDEEDWLLWENAGTYSFALLTGFNGVGPKKFYNIISNEYAEIFDRLCRKH